MTLLFPLTVPWMLVFQAIRSRFMCIPYQFTSSHHRHDDFMTDGSRDYLSDFFVGDMARCFGNISYSWLVFSVVALF